MPLDLRARALSLALVLLAALFGPQGAWASTRQDEGRLTAFSYPAITRGANPVDTAPGPDGNVWFTERGDECRGGWCNPADWTRGRIGRITPQGQVTEFAEGLSLGVQPQQITLGPDNNLWFTATARRIGRITTKGVISEFTAGISGQPEAITRGPDGNLWFTENAPAQIGRITPQGQVTEYPLPNSATYLNEITAGPDGNLWFADSNGGKIVRITPQGQVTEFSAGLSPGARPWSITLGPDRNLWFTEYASPNGKVGRITPQGVITEFVGAVDDPFNSSNVDGPAWATDITPGPDGQLWFTEMGDAQTIGKITTTGVASHPLPGGNKGGSGLTTGPDGNLWWTGRIDEVVRFDSGEPREDPVLIGAPQKGQTLVCWPGVWSQNVTRPRYRWLRDDLLLAGANRPRHKLTKADLGHQLSCQVTVTVPGLQTPVTTYSNPQLAPSRPSAWRLRQTSFPVRNGNFTLALSCSKTPGLCPGSTLQLVVRKKKQQVNLLILVPLAQAGMRSNIPVTLTPEARKLLQRGARVTLIGIGGPKKLDLRSA